LGGTRSDAGQGHGDGGELNGRDRWWAALPFLVACAPVAHLWSLNAELVKPTTGLFVLGLMLILAAVPLAVLWRLTHDLVRSAATVAIACLPVLTYGYQLDVLPDRYPALTQALTLIANAAAALGLLALAWRRDPRRVVAYATVATSLFIMSTLPGIAAGVSLAAMPTRSAAHEAIGGPDIYFIILDAYGRADVMSDMYGYDDEPFLERLRSRGFYIADASYSNYAMTHLSMAATLNMDYLPPTQPYDDAGTDQMLENAGVIHELQSHGYRYVHFATEWWGTENAPLADVVYGLAGWGGTEFERTFLRTTLPGRLLPPSRHEAVLGTFAHLTEIPSMREPTFAFAHLLVPHPPYMFDSDGTVLDYRGDLGAPFEDADAYVRQLEFVNDEMERVIDAIVAASDELPIIIVQGDHGPAFALSRITDAKTAYWERHGILNAQLVPAEVRDDLYPSISPVNTFRVLFRDLFGDDLPTLPDRSFFNWYFPNDSPAVLDDPLELREVTDLLPRD
jgi:hypothetical protein